MNTTANFQVFPTPYAFSNKKYQLKKFISEHIDKFLDTDKLIPKDKLLLDKVKKYLILNILNVKIEGDFPYSDINLKDFFKYMIDHVDNGMLRTSAVKDYVIGSFNK